MPLERRLAAEPRSAQALWNRALVASALRLPHAAAADFSAVAALGEPGWAAEARTRAAAVREGARRWSERYSRMLAEGEALVREQKAPSRAVIDEYRDHVRLFFYDAVRSATSPQELARLPPVAEALDRLYGGAILARYLARVARADFAVRGPLSARYRGYSVARWRGIPRPELRPSQLGPGPEGDFCLSPSRCGMKRLAKAMTCCPTGCRFTSR